MLGMIYMLGIKRGLMLEKERNARTNHNKRRRGRSVS